MYTVPIQYSYINGINNKISLDEYYEHLLSLYRVNNNFIFNKHVLNIKLIKVLIQIHLIN